MLKILYAAGNTQNARIQLQRFLQAIQDQPYIIKVAAYKQSSPPNVSIDWTLDCLQNMFNPDYISLDDNDNLQTYYQQLKHYEPDLIISDLEIYTSYIANLLDITLWQCSSFIINYAFPTKQKYNLGLFKRHAYALARNPISVQRAGNLLDNSNVRLVYSHFGDVDQPPLLKEGYEWVRPYHQIGKITTPCQHNIVAGLLRNDKKIFAALQRNFDSVAFTNFPFESYHNLALKSLSNQEEYFCNLRGCNLFVCEGQTSFLADAFYNGKPSAIFPNFKDPECLINSGISDSLKLSTCIYSAEELSNLSHNTVVPSYSPSIMYLHEKLEEL